MPEPEKPETDLLVERYLTGRLSSTEAEELLNRLQTEASLGDRLLDQITVDAMLREVARAERSCDAVPPSAIRIRAPWRWGRPIWWFAAVAAAGVLIVILAHQIGNVRRGNLPPGGPDNSPEATTAAVAVLTRTVDATWSQASETLKPGALLVPGTLKLKAGLAQIEFFSGARVVLQGPAEFRVVSTNEGFCQSGQLTAEVPPEASGFRIGTPQQDVVDRGTAFGLVVRPAAAEVHVFKGKVELHRKSGQPEGLGEGEAASVAGDTRRPIAANAGTFVSVAELDRRLAEVERRWQEQWREASLRLNADRGIVARFDFEGGDERTLRNVAKNHRDPASDGTVVGCGRVEGRWPGKHALEFRGVGDRVRLRIPGEFRSLTLAAWVRVNGLDRKFNSLLLTDGFEPGAVHWQIRATGHLRLGIRGIGQARHHDYDSPPVFTPERLGQWTHVAVTYDSRVRRVNHFVDGRAIRTETMAEETPLRFGTAEIGNWNPGTRRDATPIRNFSGRIDELSMHDRALTEAEVADLYRNGSGWEELR